MRCFDLGVCHEVYTRCVHGVYKVCFTCKQPPPSHKKKQKKRCVQVSATRCVSFERPGFRNLEPRVYDLGLGSLISLMLYV
jgi:hypothetical protein